MLAENAKTEQGATDTLAAFEPYALKPRYECTSGGVFFINVRTD